MQEKEEQEKEEVLQAVEEEEKREAERKHEGEEQKRWQAEATLEAECILRKQGWWMDKSVEEFWWHQQREEKQKEVDTEKRGNCLGCQTWGIDCIRE